MPPKPQQLSKRFASFVRSINSRDRVAILFHPDPDGICAAAICARSLEKLGKRVALVYHQAASGVTIKKRTVDLLRKKRINKIITVDMAVDQDPASIKEIERLASLAVIDHHIINNDLSSKKTLFLKASLINSEIPSDQYCTSKLVFDLFSPLADLSDVDWIAAIGIVADKNVETWKGFLRDVADKYSINVKRIFEAEEVVNFANSGGAKATKLYKTVFEARDIKDVIDSDLQQYVKEVRKELDYWIKNRKRFAEIYPEIKLVWYEVSPKFGVKSRLSNELSSEFWPDWTVLVITKNTKADVSARRQDRLISMHELLQTATKDIDGASSGGHVPAAGALVPVKSLEQFKRNVIDFLKNCAAGIC